MTDSSDLFRIECGACKTSHPVDDWCRTATGPMPEGEYQCPKCRMAFKRAPKANRKSWDKFVELVPVEGRL